jgi:hypothetical protein
MGLERFVGPDGFEPLDEIAGGGDVDAELPHRFDRAGIDTRNVGNVVARGVFHRDPLHAAEHPLQAGGQRVALRIDRLRAAEVVEVERLDGVHQLFRLAFRRDHVVPPAGGLGAVADARQPPCDGVRPMEVVQQPAVEPLLYQGGLDGWNRQRHRLSIDVRAGKTDGLPAAPRGGHAVRHSRGPDL